MDINYGTGEVSLKIVYYGPGLSGKTTNLEVIHNKAPATHRGRLTAIATQQDRTLFFDFMPLDLGRIKGLKTKLRLFTVPGQVYYNATRKLVLQRVDGLVFVADSKPDKMEENLASLENLRENLEELGISIKDVPLVLQYNKRDLPNILSVEELNQQLNQELNAPTFPAVAVTGEGVFPTLKCIAGLVLQAVEKMSTPKSPSTGPGLKGFSKFKKNNNEINSTQTSQVTQRSLERMKGELKKRTQTKESLPTNDG